MENTQSVYARNPKAVEEIKRKLQDNSIKLPLTNAAMDVLVTALELANETKAHCCYTSHVLQAVARIALSNYPTSAAARALAWCNMTEEAIVENHVCPKGGSLTYPFMSTSACQLLTAAEKEAKSLGDVIGLDHLLLAVLGAPTTELCKQVLVSLGVNVDYLRRRLFSMMTETPEETVRSESGLNKGLRIVSTQTAEPPLAQPVASQEKAPNDLQTALLEEIRRLVKTALDPRFALEEIARAVDKKANGDVCK